MRTLIPFDLRRSSVPDAQFSSSGVSGPPLMERSVPREVPRARRDRLQNRRSRSTATGLPANPETVHHPSGPSRQHRTPNAREGSLGPPLGVGASARLVESWCLCPGAPPIQGAAQLPDRLSIFNDRHPREHGFAGVFRPNALKDAHNCRWLCAILPAENPGITAFCERRRLRSGT
jgi:hypothetical protein